MIDSSSNVAASLSGEWFESMNAQEIHFHLAPGGAGTETGTGLENFEVDHEDRSFLRSAGFEIKRSGVIMRSKI